MQRSCRALTIVFFGALLAIGLSASPASAELVQLVCPGTQASHFDPGLTNMPQPTASTVVGVVGPCIGLPVGIVWATFESGSQGLRSCEFASVTPTAAVFLTLNWNDGTQSVAEQTSVVISRPVGQIVIVSTNRVTSGRFLNATVVRTQTLLQTNLLGCFTPQGVTDVAGPTTVTVSGLM